MRGTSHESQTTWAGCLDKRTNQSCPHKRTHQSYYNRHGEHINPGLTGEHINPATIAMENTSIQASQENLIILLHRRANHLVQQESESACPTRERIILFQCAPPGEGELPCCRMLFQ